MLCSVFGSMKSLASNFLIYHFNQILYILTINQVNLLERNQIRLILQDFIFLKSATTIFQIDYILRNQELLEELNHLDIHKIYLFNSKNNTISNKQDIMIIGSQSMSNQGQNFNDYRYQKALKQISKLIAVNRQIKTQSQRYKCQINEINQRSQELLELNYKLENQVQILRNQAKNVNECYIELQAFYKKLEQQQKQISSIKEKQLLHQQGNQQTHQQQLQEIQKHFQQQLNQMMSQIVQKDKQIQQLYQNHNSINQLQQQNNKLHQYHEKSLVQNQHLQQKLNELKKQFLNISIKIDTINTNKQSSNQQLINKLKINQQWIKSLNQENYVLKQNLLEDQYLKQKQKCNESIFQNMQDVKSLIDVSNLGIGNANQLLFKQYTKTVQKKFKKVQDDKAKVQRKYAKLKSRFNDFEGQRYQYQKQINLLTIKLSGYEQLTQRQQKEIQNMIEQFNFQMEKVLKSKKRKNLGHPMQQLESLAKIGNKQQNFQVIIQSLQNQISQNKSQLQEKERLIKFLQIKVQALQKQKIQIQNTNLELQQNLKSLKKFDLSKTSKIKNKFQPAQSQAQSQNGAKVFVINGKVYESQILKNSLSGNSKKQQEANLSNLITLKKASTEGGQGQKKTIFPTAQISYVYSQRNYDSSSQINVAQRA